jgi:hypothetical protein
MTRQERRRIQMTERKQEKKDRRSAQAALREKQRIDGLQCTPRPTPDNTKCAYNTSAEEEQARQEAAANYLKVLQRTLPHLLVRLADIKDPRDARKITHKSSVILLFGIFWFVFQKASRRQANEQLTTPTFMDNMRLFFPDLESLPHHDTVKRFLEKIDIKDLEAFLAGLINDFIRSKKFQNYLIDKCYPIAIDGTQKHVFDFLWSEECLEKKIHDQEQYSCYTIEASLVFHNGIVLPLATEFLNFMEGDESRNKQDCETNGFKRLALKIKRFFPRLKIFVIADGLFANGPIIEICRAYGWEFMIVLKDGSLPEVGKEFNALKDFDDNRKNRYAHKWGNRRQTFTWVNAISHLYDKMKKEQIVHVVVCNEEWEEVDAKGMMITKHKKFAWLSSAPLNRHTLHQRCNLGARYRWGIENGGFLVEKKYGYHYEHVFSFHWNAMKGFHLLMRIGHMMNVLAQYSNLLRVLFIKMGTQMFIKLLDETFRLFRLNSEWMKNRLAEPYQVRFG